MRLVASSPVLDCCWAETAATASILLRFWRFCCSMAMSRSSGVDKLLLSSGGGGMAIQLYWRFSTGSPQRSYSRDCERSDSKQSKQTTTNLPLSIERLFLGCRCCFRNGKSYIRIDNQMLIHNNHFVDGNELSKREVIAVECFQFELNEQTRKMK